HVLGPLSIHHVQNSGIAFGLFASATPIVIVLTGLAVAWMLGFFGRSGARHPILPVSLGLVIGGSVSNLVDRVRLGHVTDFLDLRFWPAFNLADSFIVVGVGILLLTLVLADREPRRRQRVTDAPPARPWRRGTRRAPSSTDCSHWMPPRAGRRSAPASCTGSTATHPG